MYERSYTHAFKKVFTAMLPLAARGGHLAVCAALACVGVFNGPFLPAHYKVRPRAGPGAPSLRRPAPATRERPRSVAPPARRVVSDFTWQPNLCLTTLHQIS